MRKICLIILFLQLCFAGVWQDFNGNYELRVPPGYPEAVTESISEFTPLEGKALKITASPNETALIIIEGQSTPEDINLLSFFCKADTDCEVHIALADTRGITAFANIQEYLPEKKLTNYWQKIEFPLQNVNDIDARDLRRVYLQIIPGGNSDAVIYLDDFILEKKENTPAYQVVYNFNTSQKSIFNDEPTVTARGADIELSISTQNYYGTSGGSLRLEFTTRENPAEIFLPMTASHKTNYLEIKHINFALFSESPTALFFLPETAEQHKKVKAQEPYSARRYRVALHQDDWQKINLPLEDGADFYGLRIILPANTGGVFYLDDLSLN